MALAPRNGLTKLELLLIIGVIVILTGLFLPTVRNVREAAQSTTCANNLKNLILAMHNFDPSGKPALYPASGQPDAPDGKFFPPGCIGPGTIPTERLSWMVAVLPYIEQETLAHQFNLEKGYTENLKPAQTLIKLFQCPAGYEKAQNDAVTHYIAMAGIGPDSPNQPKGTPGNGFMGYDRLTWPALIEDGTANTIALMETRADLGPWARGGNSNLRGFDPANLPLNGKLRPFGGHPDIMKAAFADGSVRSINAKIKPEKLAALITINGKEPLELD